MNDLDYIHIQNWMGKRLGLRGNLLLCFALIHGYSRNGNGVFKGSLKRLAESMFCTEPTVIACLDRLIELQLITKKKIIVDGHERCLYAVSVTFQDGELVCIDGTKEILVSHTKEILVSHTKDSLVNNKYNNKENNKEKRLSNDNQKKGEYSDDFSEFWKAYGYSRDKGTAYKRWQKLSAKDKKAALEALPAYFEDCARCKREKRYPAVYLNKRTWEDDFTSSKNEEEQEEFQYPAGMDKEKWTSIVLWMYREVYYIAGKVTPMMFAEMKKMESDSNVLCELLHMVNEEMELDSPRDVMEVFKEKFDEYHNEQGED